jgi:hypothetical protein
MAKKNAINNTSDSLTIKPGTSEDAYIQFDQSATYGDFRIGVDEDLNYALKISNGSALGTNDRFILYYSGERALPNQPGAGAVASNQTDVTGDGTTYTITWGTKYFDRGNPFMTSPYMTSTIAGVFHFNGSVGVTGLTSSHTAGYITLSTTTRDYTLGHVNPYAAVSSGGVYCFNFSMFVDMDMEEAACVKVTVSGGTKVVDIDGASTYFNGYLVG